MVSRLCHKLVPASDFNQFERKMIIPVAMANILNRLKNIRNRNECFKSQLQTILNLVGAYRAVSGEDQTFYMRCQGIQGYSNFVQRYNSDCTPYLFYS